MRFPGSRITDKLIVRYNKEKIKDTPKQMQQSNNTLV
jgi:hypothetical protein